MELNYGRYEYSDVLGWSLSRYEVFDKCKRQYYYQYYGKHATDVPAYKIRQLKELTSVPLEIGNVVHDVLEAFLRRLQKSDSNLDENRFFDYAREKVTEYFSSKTFVEVYYNGAAAADVARGRLAVETCLKNFLGSPIYTWIFMKAITNKNNWMIEPGGYGETRIVGLKAYCKMDFLFPVGDEIVILDWKTGRKDAYKHSAQLVGYAAAASANFGIPWNTIYPKIVYLSPEFDEFEIRLKESDFEAFFEKVRTQTAEMHSYCSNPEKNLPLPIDNFPRSPTPSICPYCNFQELCFPERKGPREPATPPIPV